MKRKRRGAATALWVACLLVLVLPGLVAADPRPQADPLQQGLKAFGSLLKNGASRAATAITGAVGSIQAAQSAASSRASSAAAATTPPPTLAPPLTTVVATSTTVAQVTPTSTPPPQQQTPLPQQTPPPQQTPAPQFASALPPEIPVPTTPSAIALVTSSATAGASPAESLTITVPPAVIVPQPQPAATASGLSAGAAAGQEPVLQRVAPDPVDGAFLGGVPDKTVDLPLSFVFLALFLTGAFTHISIYRANAKRGHKFLLSDLMFDFCMVRSVSTIFRIAWVFSPLRGVILAATIFQNGGAAVILAVNVFFLQRLVRSLHPKFGWSQPFSMFSLILAISVPFIIVYQIINTSVLFLSPDNPDRLSTAASLLKAGAAWVLFLAVFPIVALVIAMAVPGPPPERFGTGSTSAKEALLFAASFALAPGAAIRLFVGVNPTPPAMAGAIFSKPVFYVTQFGLEILVVALYAAARIDLLFHVPDGSSKPGDYSGRNLRDKNDSEKGYAVTRRDVEDKLAGMGVDYEILNTQTAAGSEDKELVFAIIQADKQRRAAAAARGTLTRPLTLQEPLSPMMASGARLSRVYDGAISRGVSPRNSTTGLRTSVSPLKPPLTPYMSLIQEPAPAVLTGPAGGNGPGGGDLYFTAVTTLEPSPTSATSTERIRAQQPQSHFSDDTSIYPEEPVPELPERAVKVSRRRSLIEVLSKSRRMQAAAAAARQKDMLEEEEMERERERERREELQQLQQLLQLQRGGGGGEGSTQEFVRQNAGSEGRPMLPSKQFTFLKN